MRTCGRNGTGVPTYRWIPIPKAVSSGATNATSSKPTSDNHRRISIVMSGGRRWRVQITVAPGAHNAGRNRTVAAMSASVMLPNTPHTSTRLAGTASSYGGDIPASPASTSTVGGTWSRAVAASTGSSSTSRPCTSAPRGWPSSAPARSRASPAHMLITAIGPAGPASRTSRMPCCTTASRRASGLSAMSYARCHSCQSRAMRKNHCMTYRVIQWATGLVGKEAIKGVLAHPELELVGAWVHSDDKVGRDVGELAGVGPIGVRATNSLDEICALEADAVVYAPVLASTRDVIRLLE